MCGLFGYSGVIAPDVNKLKMLGVVNTRRGTDSCGYYANGSKPILEHGINYYSDFVYYAAEYGINVNEDTTTFIGHTRKSTMGAKTIENAHPFRINDNFVGAHNGVINNWYIIKSKFDLNQSFSVDSKALLSMIDIDMEKALKLYDGFAALLFEKNGKLHVYKGASYTKEVSSWDCNTQQMTKTPAKLSEERPMVALKTKTGYYFSSLESSLMLIKEEGDEIIDLEANKVYVFNNGVLEDTIDIVRKPFQEWVKPVQTVLPLHQSNNTTNSYVGKTVGFQTAAQKLEMVKLIPSKKDRVYYSDFRYKLSGIPLHGEIKINPYGEIRGKHAVEYFFFKGFHLTEVLTNEQFVEINTILLNMYNICENLKKQNKLYPTDIYNLTNKLREYTDAPIYFDEFSKTGMVNVDKTSKGVYVSLFHNNHKITFNNFNVVADVKSVTKASIFDVGFYNLMKYEEAFWKHLILEDKFYEKTDSPEIKDILIDMVNAFDIKEDSIEEKTFLNIPQPLKLRATDYLNKIYDLACTLDEYRNEYEEIVKESEDYPEFINEFSQFFEEFVPQFESLENECFFAYQLAEENVRNGESELFDLEMIEEHLNF